MTRVWAPPAERVDETPERLGVVIATIRDTERCPNYFDEVDQCDGLDGCEACLELVAQAVLEALEA